MSHKILVVLESPSDEHTHTRTIEEKDAPAKSVVNSASKETRNAQKNDIRNTPTKWDRSLSPKKICDYMNQKNAETSVSTLARTFSDNLFTVYTAPPILYNNIASWISTEHPDKYVILCRANTVCNTPPHTIAQIVRSFIDLGAHVAYLHRYLDDCLKHRPTKIKNIYRVVPNRSDLVVFLSPTAVLALIKAQKVVSGLKQALSLVAPQFEPVSYVPNIFQFDITKRSYEEDLVKTCECKVPQKKKNKTGNGFHIWLLLYAILLGIVVIIVLLRSFYIN